ncbi:hypothetical protein THIX_20527 [Thiomonas sp. X19]|nr:hypothetical protein THIX_20527 [Thiomonas sp. X19]
MQRAASRDANIACPWVHLRGAVARSWGRGVTTCVVQPGKYGPALEDGGRRRAVLSREIPAVTAS